MRVINGQGSSYNSEWSLGRGYFNFKWHSFLYTNESIISLFNEPNRVLQFYILTNVDHVYLMIWERIVGNHFLDLEEGLAAIK